MRQGTTPIYKFKFPFSLSIVDDLLVTFKQGARLLSKHKTDGTIEADTFSFRLTQEETEAFYEGNVKGQIKILNGINVLGSTIFEVKVKPILDGTIFEVDTEEAESTQILSMSHELASCEVAIDELEQDIVVEFSECYEIKHEGDVAASDVSLNTSAYLWVGGDNVQTAFDDVDVFIGDAMDNANRALYDIVNHTSDLVGHRADAPHCLDSDRLLWNAKYTKPSSGIPSTDLSSDVNATLAKAETALQEDSLAGYATQDFVNSSIATLTAYFIGTFNSVEALNAYTGTKTPNDYAFVIVYDSIVPTQVKQYDRYKWNGSSWLYEYTLNNSSFTAEQWSAINSGITASKVAEIDGKEDKANKVTSIGASSTDEEYPSAKCVYSLIGNVEAILEAML